jgi:hypothetical protein
VAVLVVQLSDLHFNERVELPSNRYDFTVAAARLAKLAGRIKQLGRSYGASKVVITTIGDYHARNASLVGSNADSEAGLNFCSKAAQNVHIVTAQGLDGMKVDLQDTSGIEPYPFASEWEAYCPKSAGKLHEGAVVYQVIV